jgi:cell division protein FtsL
MNPVVHTDAGSRRGIGVGAFLLAIATAGALAHVGVRGKGIEVAYDLGHERRINTQLEEERRRLNIEIGMLKDPVRVVSLAREKLNMGPPAPTDIVRLQPGQILGAHAPEHVVAPKRPVRARAVDKAAARAAATTTGATTEAANPPVDDEAATSGAEPEVAP